MELTQWTRSLSKLLSENSSSVFHIVFNLYNSACVLKELNIFPNHDQILMNDIHQRNLERIKLPIIEKISKWSCLIQSLAFWVFLCFGYQNGGYQIIWKSKSTNITDNLQSYQW